MPIIRDYHILISHSWDYSQQYETIRKWLNASPYFHWTDYSPWYRVPLQNDYKYYAIIKCDLP